MQPSPPHLPPPSDEACAWSLLAEHGSRGAARALVAECGDPLAALPALEASPGGRGLAGRALARRREDCIRQQVGLLCPGDAGFPSLLACIPDAPLVLCYRGDPAVLEATGVAIVGARRASRYGLEVAHGLARELAGCGMVVVSGLALGVDGAAHRGALDGGGATVAVLGSGVNRVAPLANARLARDILDAGGLVLSEYAPEATAAPYRFPERNRLISGLSAGVVVVEASERSGSLITARLAMEQGREVMAVPGLPGLPNSGGVNRLLKSGAALIETGRDVLLALGRDLPGFAPELTAGPERLTPELARILDHLEGCARSLDELSVVLGLDAQSCAARLTELELGGFVRRVADGYIRRPAGF